MAGTAQAGVEAGLTGLFAGRPWVATPTDATDPEALAVVRGLAAAVDAEWIECPAADHDQAVALISHLPVLLGAALIEAAGPVPLARLLASSGFADTSRVGGGNPELGTLMARYNREALLEALARYRTSLEDLEQRVRGGDWPGLAQRLSQAQALRPEFL
jgi:arogenate dehydrogenase (NADP+)